MNNDDDVMLAARLLGSLTIVGENEPIENTSNAIAIPADGASVVSEATSAVVPQESSASIVSLIPCHIFICTHDDMMLHHKIGWKAPREFPLSPKEVPKNYVEENFGRLESILERVTLLRSKIDGETIFIDLECRPATPEMILRVHSKEHYHSIAATQNMTNRQLISKKTNDMYYCRKTFHAARLACGGVVSCVDAVLQPQTAARDAGDARRRALAIVRPPGHHCPHHQEQGFCFFNNIVIGARHAQVQHGVQRIVILDIDVHHGNGTQDLTLDDPNLLYISLHRYFEMEDGTMFFPSTGRPEETGANGSNLNVAWTTPHDNTVGNVAYGAAFSELIAPLIHAFEPELLLVSCGFDAAKGDLLGGCCLTPDFYYAMMQAVMAAAGSQTPVVGALEGGYNMEMLADCTESVALAMVNRPLDDGIVGSRDDGMPVYPFPTCVASTDSLENELDTTGLQVAREWLKPYYNFDDPRAAMKKIDPRAAQDIYDSLVAIGSCERWKTLDLRSMKVPGIDHATWETVDAV